MSGASSSARKRPSLLAWLVPVLALLALAWFGAPYLAAARTVEALQSADPDRIAAVTDFEALRADLRADARAAVEARLAAEGVPEGRLGVADALLGPLIDGLVEGIATPDGLARLVSSYRREGDRTYSFGEILTRVAGAGRYAPPGFVVTIPPETPEGEPYSLAFARRGLIDWRLVGLDVPGGVSP